MKAVLATLLALAGTAAFADDASQALANRTPFQSVLARQAVQAEYLAARRDGTLPVTTEAAALEPVVLVRGDEHARQHARDEAREAARSRVAHELM